MKKFFSIISFVAFVCFFNMNYLFAKDGNDDGTLELNTEDVKNKQEDYSSLTDLNGLNLFTNDLKTILELEDKSIDNEEKKEKNNLFIKLNNKNESNQDEKDMIFKNPVSFDKTNLSTQTEISLAPFFAMFTIILGMVVFVLTRKKYKNKESEEVENNNNFYE